MTSIVVLCATLSITGAAPGTGPTLLDRPGEGLLLGDAGGARSARRSQLRLLAQATPGEPAGPEGEWSSLDEGEPRPEQPDPAGPAGEASSSQPPLNAAAAPQAPAASGGEDVAPEQEAPLDPAAARTMEIDEADQRDSYLAGRAVAMAASVGGGVLVGGIVGGIAGLILISGAGFAGDPITGLVLLILIPTAGAALGAVGLGVLGGALLNLFYPPFVYRPRPPSETLELPKNTVSVGVVHPFYGLFEAEYERRLSDSITAFVSPSVRYRRLYGYYREGGVGLAVGARYFLFGLAPRGLFAEGAGYVRHAQFRNNTDATNFNRTLSTSVGGELSLGYALLLWRHALISVGFGVEGEYDFSVYESTNPTDPTPPSFNRFRFLPHGRASIGFAF